MLSTMRVILAGAAALTAFGADEPRVIRMVGVGQGQAGAPVVVVPGQKMVAIAPHAGQVDAVEMPAVWLGLRLTPIPAPLAAHVGKAGMMVGNIATGSPADSAGLEQYDVVVAYGGTAINDMDDLLTELKDASAGQAAQLEIIRAGKRQTVSIKPAARPQGDEKTEYKYDEPDAQVSSVQMRGKRVKLGPDGQWMVEDMGPLAQLPDALEELKGLDMGNWGQWMGRPGVAVPFHFDGLQNLSDLGRWNVFLGPDGDVNIDTDADAKSSMSVSIAKDGETLSISRDENGAFSVSKTDNDGNSSSATYDSAEEFRKQDSETYAKFRQMTGHRRAMFFHGGGGPDELPQMQQDFQERVQKIIAEARAKVDEARQMTQQEKTKMRQGKGGQ